MSVCWYPVVLLGLVVLLLLLVEYRQHLARKRRVAKMRELLVSRGPQWEMYATAAAIIPLGMQEVVLATALRESDSSSRREET